MKKIEHIGIAVKNFEVSVPLYEKMLNTTCYKQELVASEKVNTAFFKVGESKIELLCSTDPEGVIARYIDKKGEGIHHIAYEVEDIYAEMARMQTEGFTLLQDEITALIFLRLLAQLLGSHLFCCSPFQVQSLRRRW
ncbi:MAG: VOC family protein [Sediminibacterium sp.]|nr:VOC family protein [Sediminibacterium sp.]